MQSPVSHTNSSMNSIIRLIEGAWCAVFIVVPSIWYVILFARLLHTPFASDNPSRALGAATPYLIVVLGIEVCYGVALARFVVRLIPPRFADGNGTRHIMRLLLLAACISPLILLLVVLIPSAKIALAISIAIWLACVWPPLHSANRKLNQLSRGNFIVFLRRFSTFADRAVIGLVHSQVPRHKPLVVLTPGVSQPGDWNPYLVGFAGFKFRAPVRSMPVVLRALDTDWETPARTLIDNAHLIVLDISQGSAAIQKEMSMIEDGNRWPDTICVKDATTGDVAWGDSFPAKAGWLVFYKRNWAQVLPRLILFLALSVWVLLYLNTLVIQSSHPVSETDKLLATSIAVILWIVPFLSGLGLLIYSTFIYPSITLSAKPALRRALRNVPGDATLIRNFQTHQQDFERLVNMSLDDAKKVAPTSLHVITAKGDSDDHELTLASERREEYLALFHSLKLHHGLRLQSTDSILLVSDNNIVGRKGCEKGYVYTQNQLSPVYNSLDIQSARGRYLFRELKPNWYLYLYEK